MKTKKINWLKLFKDFVYVWGVFITSIVATISYLEIDCTGCLSMYWPEIAIVTIVTLAIIILWAWFKRELEVSVDKVHCSLVKFQVESFYRTHKDSDVLSDDDLKQVYEMEQEMDNLGINSYTHRKIERLKEKQ